MSKADATFLELTLTGDVELDDIDDFVDAWHDGSDDRELRDYLGLTSNEYRAWVEEPGLLAFIVTARKDRRDFVELVEQSFREYKLAARSETEREISAVQKWLKEHGKLD